MDMRIELIGVPVSDIARSREFYSRLGWNIDFDQEVDADTHFVQVTPPGSACSICFGRGIVEMEPGSLRGVQLVVDDADAALAHLQSVGVEARGVVEWDWGRFVFFQDPDGNGFALQQLPPRAA